MPANTLLAGTVMDAAAALLNDSAKVTYGYTVQPPYLNMALKELQEYYELHEISVTDAVSAPVIQMDAGQTEITYGATTSPALPNDLIEPLQLWERARNTDPFIPMTKKNFLPHNLEGIASNQFIYWVWQSQKIVVLAANQNNDIKMDYTRNLFQPVVNESSGINVVNAATFLEYRTAGLMAEFIERNQPSADKLNAYSQLAIDRAAGIDIKGKQRIMTRRRPFRGSYIRGGWVT